MSIVTTPLSTLLNRMNRWQTIASIEESDKVRDLDEAIRTLREEFQFPWTLQQSTLRVFSGVFVYPTAADHDEMAYLDVTQNVDYGAHARFKSTSMTEFMENQDSSRNTLTELWDAGVKYIGCNYQPVSAPSVLVDDASSISGWTVTGDAGTLVLDTVVFKTGNSSVRVPITLNTSLASVTSSIATQINTNYMRSYYFRWVYLGGIPSAISMKFGTSSSGYLLGTVTTQFSGQPFKLNDWNLLAFDMNNPTSVVGTGITNGTFAYESILLAGAPTGTYYIDASYMRQWELMKYWYYSKYSCVTNGSPTADQEYFIQDDPNYELDTSLIGESEFANVIMYDAMTSSLTDKENMVVLNEIKAKRAVAWGRLEQQYPSLRQIITTTRYRTKTDYTNTNTAYPR